MIYLFDSWGKVSSAICACDHIFLLSDFDGTLTPIVSEPGLVRLEDGIRRHLRSISRRERFTVGLISGRNLRELRALVRIPGIVYSGNHGFELKVPKRREFVHPKALIIKPIIESLEQSLVKRLRGIEGVIVENKGFSLSLHYRLVKDRFVPRVKKIFAAEISPYIGQGKVKVTYGKKVLEVRPQVDWDKGKVIAQIIKDARPARPTRGKKVLAIYLGDDRTDEDGFLALKDKGISILVGRKKRSYAKYFLKDVKDVKEFLRRIDSLGLVSRITERRKVWG